jgi:hypothetical protein
MILCFNSKYPILLSFYPVWSIIFFLSFSRPRNLLLPTFLPGKEKNMVNETEMLNISGILEKFLLKVLGLPNHGHGVKCRSAKGGRQLGLCRSYSTRK